MRRELVRGRGRRAVGIAALLVGVAAAAGCKGRKHESGPTPQPTTGPAVAVIDLSGGVPEVPTANMLGLSSKRTTFDEALRALERARKDAKVKAVVVRFGGVSFGLARAEELGEALARVKADKPVDCHAEAFSNATYFAAARGCRKLFVAPAGEVETIGLAAQIVYFRKLLVDELKLSVDILQVGKFKGAEEPLTRDGPSPEARKSLEGVLADLREQWLSGFRSARAGALAHVEEGPHTGDKAKERGLVDDVVYFDQVKERLRSETGAVRDEVRFGGGARKGDGDLGDLFRALAGEGAVAPIALVRAAGSIRMSGDGGPFGDGDGISEKELSKLLARVEKDDRIKVLVVRIDSPGGSALASDLVWHQLMRIREKKPIVVSVGEMAASGGYYLASTGSWIVADATSILGSIGVVGGKIGLGDGLERFGVHAETFPAKVGDKEAGTRAAYLSTFVRWDDKTRERVRESMTGIYDLFLRRVAEGRKTTVDKIAPSAEGQIFSGRVAKERGLVDELGGLATAMAKAKELAKLPEDTKVILLDNRPSLFDLLGDEAEVETKAPAVGPSLVAAALDRAPEELRTFARSLEPLAGRERVVVSVPFGFVVR